MSESKRPDALTAFFLVAAVVLGGMWWLEQRDVEELETANRLASEFSRDQLPASCEAFAAGQAGAELVLKCERVTELEKIDPATAFAAGFRSVLLIEDAGKARRCFPEQEHCDEVNLPQ